VRSRISVGLVIVCLGLAGCGVLDKNNGKSAAAPKPFTGLPATQDPPSGPGIDRASGNGLDTGLPPRVDGVVAGQVVNKDTNRRMTNAHIEVVDLQNSRRNKADLGVETDGNGYFVIRGLEKGHDYQLIARARDDGRILSGAELVKPPNIKVNILLVEDTTPGASDNFPNPPLLPGQQPLNRDPKPSGPAAFLDPPIGSRTDPGNVAPTPGPTPTRPEPAVAPDRLAETQDGFPKALPKDQPANMNGPAPDYIPPPPPGSNQGVPAITTTGPSQPIDPQLAPGTGYGNDPPPPWCVLQGRQLKGLALYGLDLQPWDFQRNRKGRVILLDFWSTSCGPCVKAITHLCDLQGTYGPYGLEVIGIAYESGAFSEQARKVRAVRARWLINYTTLLGGGNQGECPVKRQFQVTYLPTLVLLNENGIVVWRSNEDGLTPEKYRELRSEISRQLRIATPGR
jgi:thiol-disulfide isomerase/thioredoxin